MVPVTRNIVIFGCGYVGGKIATRELENRNSVFAVVSSPESKARHTSAYPVEACDLDVHTPGQTILAPTAGAVLYYLVPPSSNIPDARIRNFFRLLSSDVPQKIILISTTGVYGDCAGEWIDETQAVRPMAERARRRVDVEEYAIRACKERNIALIIIRVPGIYGCDRLPLDRIRKQLPVLRESESPWSNRIHVEDLVQVCIHAARYGEAGDIYNAADGNPTTMTDYFNRVADRFRLPRPPQISRAEAEQGLSRGMLSYLDESKRIRIDKIRERLHVVLKYPDLGAGLRDCGEPD